MTSLNKICTVVPRRADSWSGIFFIVLGGGALIYSLASYRMGMPAKMGPGFFPALVGAVIAMLGMVILLLDLRKVAHAETAPVEDCSDFGWRPMLAILGSVVAFALLIKPLGMIVSVVAMVVIARLARRGNWLELAVLASVLSLIAYAIFVVGLKMPFKVAPW